MEQRNNLYRTVSGQQDGQHVVSNWSTAEPKNTGKSNATDAVEQATAEVEAKYKKQLKSGGYFKSVKDIDQERFFQPMLAKSFEDYADDIDWSKGVGVQVKYNGGRIIARKEGLFSRKGEKYENLAHIEACLQPFFQKYPDAILDGEGYNYNFRQKLNEIMKLLRRTVNITPAHQKASSELVRFYIYDGFGFGASKEDGYNKRKEAIDNEFLAAYKEGSAIHHVPTWTVTSKKALDTLYESFLKDDQEGAIIRILNAPYEQKRTKNLLKYKPIDTAEFEILSIEEGDGNRSKMAGAVWLQYPDGRAFKASLKGDEAQFREILQRQREFIGKSVTIHYNGLTGKDKGVPNFARLDCNNYDQTGDCPKLIN